MIVTASINAFLVVEEFIREYNLNNSIFDKESIARLIFKAAELQHACANRLLKPFDLTMEQAWVLLHLKNDDSVSQKALSEAAAKDQANTARILRRLLKKELIRIKSDTSDKRVKLVTIAPKGNKLLESIQGKVIEASERLNPFTDEERKKLTSLLMRYVKLSEEVKEYWKN
jgi:DNA-binding MarR family transcriptional regulator